MNIRGWLLSFACFALSLGCPDRLLGADESQPTPATDDSAACHCVGSSSLAAARIERVLAGPLKATGLDFTEEPLENVVNFLQSEYEIPIQLDIPALEDAGLTSDEKITISVMNISIRSALRLLLKQKQLTYVMRDEVLIITTPEEAESELSVCVYDVRDLVGPRYDAKELDRLVDTILSCVALETWAKHGGGEAEIRPLRPGLLVISQTQAVHEQIADLLRAIRGTLSRPTDSRSESGVAEPSDDLFGSGGGRGGYGMEGRGMGMDGGRGGGYGGGESGGSRGSETEPEPTPAGGDSPFD